MFPTSLTLLLWCVPADVLVFLISKLLNSNLLLPLRTTFIVKIIFNGLHAKWFAIFLVSEKYELETKSCIFHSRLCISDKLIETKFKFVRRNQPLLQFTSPNAIVMLHGHSNYYFKVFESILHTTRLQYTRIDLEAIGTFVPATKP